MSEEFNIQVRIPDKNEKRSELRKLKIFINSELDREGVLELIKLLQQIVNKNFTVDLETE